MLVMNIPPIDSAMGTSGISVEVERGNKAAY
jgi:hypothetical protein